MKIVIAGPWIGEFGWELFCWQGHLRYWLKNHPDHRMIVVCRPGHEILYADFAHDFIPHSPESGETDCWYCRGEDTKIKLPHHNARLDPYELQITWKRDKSDRYKKQEFFKYGGDIATRLRAVTIHARSTTKCNSKERNWPLYKWNELVEKIKDLGFNVISIGRTDSAHHIAGTVDFRGVNLQETVNILAASTATLGPSSGPMHLASLCGCPHIVWSGSDDNKVRYHHDWNPFKTPVTHIGSWQPEAKNVIYQFESLVNNV